ncbi:DsrE family protein [Roseiflexus sp.]|uniref:DsrE family protein n=1 Tax=Roseiflexus sp. TaxID=2562120 RepID=UPI002585330C|nr:DsrE family protein [Roseiflexus sp.]
MAKDYSVAAVTAAQSYSYSHLNAMTTKPQLVIIITHAGHDPGAATLGFLTASAALAAGNRAAVLLRGEGVLCATSEGWAAGLHAAGYPPLREARDAYRTAGGTLYLSQPCLRRYWLNADNGLLPDVRVLSIEDIAALCVGTTTVTF